MTTKGAKMTSVGRVYLKLTSFADGTIFGGGISQRPQWATAGTGVYVSVLRDGSRADKLLDWTWTDDTVLSVNGQSFGPNDKLPLLCNSRDTIEIVISRRIEDIPKGWSVPGATIEVGFPLMRPED